MRRGLERALDECLSQLNTGELGLEDVLARYPEHEAELRPLLRTAMLVRRVPQAVPSLEAKAAGRQRLLSAVARKRREKARARPGLLRRLEQSAAILVQPLVQPQRQPLRLAQAIAALLVIVSIVSAGTVGVAADSLPDSPLYPIKLTTERVRLALATTAAGKARLHMSYSERRLGEAQALWEAGKGYEATLQAMEIEKSDVWTAIGKVSDEERPKLLGDLILLEARHQTILEEMKSESPPSDHEAVEKALEASGEHQRKATEAMTALHTPTPSPRPTDTVAVYAHAETPTPAPTATSVPPTATPVLPTATPVPMPTVKPAATPQAGVIFTVTPEVETTATPTPTLTPEPTATPQAGVIFTPTTVEPTPSPTLTATPTLTPTVTLTATPTPTPTVEPTVTPTGQAEAPFQPLPGSSVTKCWVSDAPEGEAMDEFPAGTRTVYIVFEYVYMAGEEVGIKVTDNVGNVLFDEVRTLSGDDTVSIAFSAGEGGFAAGRYLVNIYKGGGLIKTIIWDVVK